MLRPCSVRWLLFIAVRSVFTDRDETIISSSGVAVVLICCSETSKNLYSDRTVLSRVEENNLLELLLRCSETAALRRRTVSSSRLHRSGAL